MTAMLLHSCNDDCYEVRSYILFITNIHQEREQMDDDQLTTVQDSMDADMPEQSRLFICCEY